MLKRHERHYVTDPSAEQKAFIIIITIKNVEVDL